MHELAITDSIIKQAITEAQKHNAQRINKIKLKIGVASAIIPNCVEFYFDILKKNTIAENAKLDFEIVPIVIKCPQCQSQVQITPENGEKLNSKLLGCECNAGIELIEGNDVLIEYIDIE
ncbi:MAG: hydrogenase maturation nickel metallochaperone HypA [candidate division WOR-3 bacterium]|nr:hydrogenase maturation nickel metallochaperone HypA [candidate division WOR-3 bacterium]MCX7756868.1 hydrogenase maturation nickel metallochaperone HypA [candidate division WOR-3 bacterium]MDW7987912.1 hydrogenase maturation nickel metallochaperone HypA [candidate division WOR-3 bacterium]